MYYSSIPCKISLNVILGDDLSRSERTSISRVLYLHSSVYHICPRKIFISVKGLHSVSWESRLALMRMTAAVSFTLCSVDRRWNSKDPCEGTAELTARAATAINISGSNNQGCLFFSEVIRKYDWLVLKMVVVLTDFRADGDCFLSVCCVHADAASDTCAEMKPTGCECTHMNGGGNNDTAAICQSSALSLKSCFS